MSITLTSLSESPPCYLLTIDSAKILLDCGIHDTTAEFPSSSNSTSTDPNGTYLKRLRDLAPSLNLVIVTHPLLTSLGLLPWLKAKCGLRCPVYATLPTREMGRYAVEEWVVTRSEEEENEGFREGEAALDKATIKPKGKGKRTKMEVDDQVAQVEGGEEVTIDGTEVKEEDLMQQVWKLSVHEVRQAFLTVNAVRWTQPVHLSGQSKSCPLKGYTLVAHRSGHTLGGSLFTIRPSLSSSLSPASSASSFLYAPIFNHVKEHHLDSSALLNGAKIDEAMRRMGVVVVGAERSLMVNVKRMDKEKTFLDCVTTTMRNNHSVLLPVDASARILELLVLLETHWSFESLGRQFPLCVVSRTAKDVFVFTRSLTEWMGGQVGRQVGDEKILKFPNVRIYPSIEALNADIPPEVPKTILVTPLSLSHGFSRKLFVEFAQVPGNVVLLTQTSDEGSLTRWLFGLWDEAQTEGEKWGEGKVGRAVKMDRTLDLKMKRKVYLEGEELERYLAAEREIEEREARHQAALDRSRRMLHTQGDNSDSDSDLDSDVEDAEEAIKEEGVVVPAPRRRTGGFTGGLGAWDEFLDESNLSGRAATFDIYVKGEAGVKRVMDGLNRYRMFPVVERKRRVDAYGEAIDIEGWLKRGIDEDPMTMGLAVGNSNAAKLLGQAAAALGVGGTGANKKIKMEEEKVKEKEVEKPHKYVVDEVQVRIVCSIFVVDFEGASDGRALKTILPQMNPRKLVIVNGSQASINDLAAHCQAVNAYSEEIFTPSLNESIVVGHETKNFSIRLGDSIMASLRLSRVESYDVAYVSGVVRFDPESDLPVLEKVGVLEGAGQLRIEGNAEAEAEVTEEEIKVEQGVGDEEKEKEKGEQDDKMDADSITPSTSLIKTLPPLRPSLFIGDLRLTLLKERLAARGIPSEFAGQGILLCRPAPPQSFGYKGELNLSGGRVVVKKSGRGRVMIEGTPGETYHVVREVVYSLHAQAG
ncbi:BQ5605_C018g08616 [Microbotryum silenes-dioicae]|uniref:Cleavage and polyadenylation specificity factor subunit 2 n=1 Tax=Microbotryum silenes-dioicae TaxID=796604 RepID=A0A2X0P0A7_9BASI|nr:BQ5605_C018g08616 [Microbotryum silenes-dioicae]